MFRVCRVVVGACVLSVLAACGSSRSSGADRGDEIEECTSYLSTYQTCVGRLSPAGENDARIVAMRSRFTPAIAEAERETQRAACASALKQLAAACK